MDGGVQRSAFHERFVILALFVDGMSRSNVDGMRPPEYELIRERQERRSPNPPKFRREDLRSGNGFSTHSDRGELDPRRRTPPTGIQRAENSTRGGGERRTRTLLKTRPAAAAESGELDPERQSRRRAENSTRSGGTQCVVRKFVRCSEKSCCVYEQLSRSELCKNYRAGNRCT